MRRPLVTTLLTSSLLLVAACDKKADEPTAPEPAPAPAAEDPEPTAEDAKAFVAEVDAELTRLGIAAGRAAWANATDITDAHTAAEAEATEAWLAYLSGAIERSKAFDGVDADPVTMRQLRMLRIATTMPAPNDAAKRKELTEVTAKLQGMYGKGKFCTRDRRDKETCRTLGQLEDVLAESTKPAKLEEAWTGWRTVSPPMRDMYTRFVELSNEGARELGFKDTGELWRSKYDMTPAEFEAETERLWQQVSPLYEQLHCYVRSRLADEYGKDEVSLDGKIPAHLLGNMWSQEWGNIYPLVEPYAKQPSIDVTKALKKKKFTSKKMVETAEGFFTSLGLEKLPDTFWERSMFDKPADRDAVCHASAWEIERDSKDVRIKMCIKTNMSDLVTIHHELGHNYYYLYYWDQPALFREGAHDGFHEGIGDTLALSVTPQYLKTLGLLDEVSNSDKATINKQMQDALDKIAFLPFGLMIDKWRWGVFSGEITPENYNAAWWSLRERYQGIQAPNARTEEHFDPGAKYHIPGNTPYVRYFLARILQFQFHKALCEAAGHEGPLHTCSIYGSKEAGEKLSAMLAMGSSQPWPDALEAIAGTRQMDASALIEYFDPLMKWLEKENEGLTCGWK